MNLSGLRDFGLTPSKLKKLGNRRVSFLVQQRGLSIATLRRLTPAQRQLRLATLLQRRLEHMVRRWPEAQFKARGDDKMPWTIDGILPARVVPSVASMSGIQVHIAKVSGLRRRRPQRVGGWFCVWGRVAIQIEGKRRGMIDVEDRLVLVKARNEKQAKARLSSEWRAYSEPYLNHRGEMVRWKLTEVQDVYELFDGEINPKGTEVYSRLDQRRMRAADAWMPARSAPMTLRALEKSSRTPPAPANRRTGHLQIRR